MQTTSNAIFEVRHGRASLAFKTQRKSQSGGSTADYS